MNSGFVSVSVGTQEARLHCKSNETLTSATNQTISIERVPDNRRRIIVFRWINELY